MIQRVLSPIGRIFRRFLYDRRGNVLMIFGLSIIPLIFATGMGIDYSRAMKLQTKLNAVSDAAALASVSSAMMNQSIINACNVARASFATQSAGLPGLTLNNSDPTQVSIAVTDTYASIAPVALTCPVSGVSATAPSILPLSRVTTVTYRGASNNAFAGVLGVNTLTVKGTTSAKTILAPYIDIHLALDTSQSMGLAATDADAVKLYNATAYADGAANGCTFGCHAFAGGGASAGSPNYKYSYANDYIAKLAGAQLRIDVLRAASNDMVSAAIANEGAQQLYRFGLYRVGQTTSTISPLSTNLSQTLSDISSLTLGPNSSGGIGDSNLADMTTSVLPNIIAHGDGTTQSKARAFLFIVTDGVSDVAGGCTDGHCTRPLDPTTCQQYKDAGVIVGVVYTTYLPIYLTPLNPSALDQRYIDLVKHFSASGYNSANPSDNSLDIAPALQACASPGYFFQAADGPGIQAAMNKLFTQATQTPIITH